MLWGGRGGTLIQTKQKCADKGTSTSQEQKQVQTKNRNKNNTFQSDPPARRQAGGFLQEVLHCNLFCNSESRALGKRVALKHFPGIEDGGSGIWDEQTEIRCSNDHWFLHLSRMVECCIRWRWLKAVICFVCSQEVTHLSSSDSELDDDQPQAALLGSRWKNWKGAVLTMAVGRRCG